jgi:hypothetical protein
VASIHLLTTPGTWLVTDQAESLFVARRLLDHGTFVLADTGVTRIAALPWVIATPGRTLRSRHYPANAASLAPLLYLDRLFGWEDPVEYGRLVHLHGHLFVFAALALLGWALATEGVSAMAIAMAIVLAGLTWPIWQVSRRGGPEPILVFLVCLFVLAEARERHSRPATHRGATLLKTLACLLLPWVHPTGTLIGAALLAGTMVAQIRTRAPGTSPLRALRPLLAPAGAFAASILALIAVWNHLYHGNWLAGGYGLYSAEWSVPRLVALALRSAWIYLRETALQNFALLLAVALGLWAAGRPWENGLAQPLLLTAVLLAFFSVYVIPEPARRLAAVWPVWAAVAARTWDRLALPPPWPQALLAAGGLIGFHWFLAVDGRYYLGPGGLYYPSVLWVKLAIAGRHLPETILAVSALLALALLASAKVWRLLSDRPSA